MASVFHFSPNSGNIRIDGDFGNYTRRQLQQFLRWTGHYKRATDGNFGKESQLALQKFLQRNGFTYYHGVLDGVAGKMTWYAWFDYLKARRIRNFDGTYTYGYWNGGSIWTSGRKPAYGLTVSTQHFLNDRGKFAY